MALLVIPSPGDILLTRDPTKGFKTAGFWVRLGAWLTRKPTTHDHVVVVSHVDDANTYWGIEARPGVVGWVDIAHYLVSPYTVVNTAQPKTDLQRAQIVEVAKGLLGVKYDWSSIVEDGMRAIHAGDLWQARDFNGEVPTHLICSALAAWVYAKVGLAIPKGHEIRFMTPGDWTHFIQTREWETV
jgi:hypothetical protein